MTVSRSKENKIWLTEIFRGEGNPSESEQEWKLWGQSYPFDSYVALREWHDYAPPYFPYPNGGSDNDPNIYWTKVHTNPNEPDESKKVTKTYWRAYQAEVMNVNDTLEASIAEDDLHLTDVTNKLHQHVKRYKSEKMGELWKPDFAHFYQDLENLVDRYSSKSKSEDFKELVFRFKEMYEDMLDPLI